MPTGTPPLDGFGYGRLATDLIEATWPGLQEISSATGGGMGTRISWADGPTAAQVANLLDRALPPLLKASGPRQLARLYTHPARFTALLTLRDAGQPAPTRAEIDAHLAEVSFDVGWTPPPAARLAADLFTSWLAEQTPAQPDAFGFIAGRLPYPAEVAALPTWYAEHRADVDAVLAGVLSPAAAGAAPAAEHG